MAFETQRVLLVFSVGGQTAALPLESVVRITPMAELARPPGMPSPLEGILNLGGAAVPVLRLDRLFRLQAQDIHLYSMLIILRSDVQGRYGLLVERVNELLSVSAGEWLPVKAQDSFNSCAEASVLLRGRAIPVLSPHHILLEKETQILAEFQTVAQQRIEKWGAANP